MPIYVQVKKSTYESVGQRHAEEEMFSTGRYDSGDLVVSMNGGPCVGYGKGHGHNCHGLFLRKSAGRTITVEVTDDRGGYAADHGKLYGSTGRIVYRNGVASYT